MNQGATTGTIRLVLRDLLVPTIEMSWFLRLRFVSLTIFVLGAAPVLDSSDVTPPGYGIVLLCGIAYVLWAAYVMPQLRTRRLLRSLVHSGGGDATYRFDNDHLTIEVGSTSTTTEYGALVKAQEGSTAFLLYCNPRVANIVPKRAFAPDAVARLRTLVAARVALEDVVVGRRRAILALGLIFAILVAWQTYVHMPL
jgi:hypothetical protein